MLRIECTLSSKIVHIFKVMCPKYLVLVILERLINEKKCFQLNRLTTSVIFRVCKHILTSYYSSRFFLSTYAVFYIDYNVVTKRIVQQGVISSPFRKAIIKPFSQQESKLPSITRTREIAQIIQFTNEKQRCEREREREREI